MMPIDNFTLFVTLTFLVSASPGPVMLSCMSNGARFGVKKAVDGMIGASLGNLVLMAVSAVGLGLVISENNFLFNALKWAGAAYLVWMGIQIIRTPTPDTSAAPFTDARPSDQLTPQSSSKLGLNSFFIALSNPKGLLYFGALFPQFINYQQPLALQFLYLTIVFLLTDFVWMYAYAVAGNKIMGWLKAPTHQRLFNVFSGVVLMAAGVFMLLSGKN